MKNAIRGKEDDEDAWRKRMRALYSSSLIGTLERPLSLVAPLYNPRSHVGDAIGNTLGHTPGKLVNTLIGESPQLSYVDDVIGVAEDAITGDLNLKRNFIDIAPAGSLIKDYLTEYQKES